MKLSRATGVQSWRIVTGALVLVCIAFWTRLLTNVVGVKELTGESAILSALRDAGDFDICPQEPPYNASAARRGKRIELPALRQTVERISHAVRIDTSVNDDAPSPDESPAWWSRIFSPFHRWLVHAFPHLHRRLKREFIHGSGVLYTWNGTDPSLKPLLLTAHQDVVPIEPLTASKWRYAPFSGFIDLETQTIWGRGAFDCKLPLIGIMSAIDSLAGAGWKPRRTIVISLGFDEESGGKYGAAALGMELLHRYGEDSFAMLVDEGLPVMPKSGAGSIGRGLAFPAVQEKGTMSVYLSLGTTGGHSSLPPMHTSIGIMSEMLTALEQNPFVPKITGGYNPALQRLQCIRDTPAVSPELREALYQLAGAERIQNSTRGFPSLLLAAGPSSTRVERLRERVLSLLPPVEVNSFRTTQAIDIIHGGVKMNALPESVTAGVNHRIAPHESTQDVRNHYRDLLLPIARRYGISVDFFGTYIPAPSTPRGTLNLTTSPWLLESARGSSYSEDSPAWRLLSSVIRQTWDEGEERHDLESDVVAVRERTQPVLVTPSLFVGNTDTHWYSALTPNVFRFGPGSLHEDLTGLGYITGIHTVDEHVSIDGMYKAVDFYTNLIVAVDYEELP